MEWEKAKQVFIYILIAINIVLFAFNYKNSRKYTITAAQEKAVYTLLSNNGIGLYTELISDYEPMRQIAVTSKTIDDDDIRKSFFQADENVSITVEFDSTIYQSGEKTVAISGNRIVFSNPKGTADIKNLNRKNAVEEAEKFLKTVGFDNIKSAQAGDVKEREDGYVVEFSESYNDIKMFCSTEDIFVTSKGVEEATLVFYTPDGYTGEKKEICSCDEALLTVLYEMKDEESGVKKGTYIEKIERGYDFQEESDISEINTFRLVPCYRVYVSNREDAYMVNAYTNTIIEE